MGVKICHSLTSKGPLQTHRNSERGKGTVVIYLCGRTSRLECDRWYYQGNRWVLPFNWLLPCHDSPVDCWNTSTGPVFECWIDECTFPPKTLFQLHLLERAGLVLFSTCLFMVGNFRVFLPLSRQIRQFSSRTEFFSKYKQAWLFFETNWSSSKFSSSKFPPQ